MGRRNERGDRGSWGRRVVATCAHVLAPLRDRGGGHVSMRPPPRADVEAQGRGGDQTGQWASQLLPCALSADMTPKRSRHSRPPERAPGSG